MQTPWSLLLSPFFENKGYDALGLLLHMNRI